MRWTVRLEARTDQGEVKTTELVTFDRPVVDGTLADLGLRLSEAKALLAELQASMVQGQVAEYAACRRACPQCWVPQPLEDRRTRASVRSSSGAWPAPVSWKAVAMVKQPAWAAAISSSGLVPRSSPKRLAKE